MNTESVLGVQNSYVPALFDSTEGFERSQVRSPQREVTSGRMQLSFRTCFNFNPL